MLQKTDNFRDIKLLFAVNYLVFYYTWFFFGYLNKSLLSQTVPVLFVNGRDLSQLLLMLTGIPGLFIAHPFLYVVADVLVLAPPVIIFIFYLRTGRFPVLLSSLFIACFYIYCLLLGILWQVSLLTHIQYLILSFMFVCNRKENFQLVINTSRWMMLYVMASAAIWKIARGAGLNPSQLSNILIAQHTDSLPDCQTLLCQFRIYLIEHPMASQGLYISATLLELCFAVGFFTRKYDKVLFILLVAFVFSDQLIMRIPYWSLLVSGLSLLKSQSLFSLKK